MTLMKYKPIAPGVYADKMSIFTPPITKKAWLGLDPGASGSICAITDDGEIKVIRFAKSTEKEIWQFFNSLAFDYECFCVKEKVWAMPATNEDGTKRGMGAQTMFTFGENNGIVKGFLVAAGIPYEEKVPQTWQKLFGMKKEKNEAQPDYKRRLKQKAEQLFPKQKITADVSDALLLAEFARRTHI